MLHLWSLATWGVHITHDAGMPEWIDQPVTNWVIENLTLSDESFSDGGKWTLRLPATLHLLTAWWMDEYCEDLYITCIDPNGITLHRSLIEQEFQENIPRIHVANIPLSHLWYTVDGFYTFTFTYFYGGLPYEHFGSFRFRLERKGIGHE